MSHVTIVSNAGGLAILDGVEDRLKAYFMAQTRCRIEPANISVGPEGWDVDGATIWVSFESWDRQNFCNSDPVYFAQYDLTRRAVVSHLSVDETMARFCPDAGFRQQFGPNCLEYERRRGRGD